MAHFAELDENNIVTSVVVVNNDALDTAKEEESGVEFLTNLYGHSRWKQTSFNGNFRGCYAGVGYEYLPAQDLFVEPSEEN